MATIIFNEEEEESVEWNHWIPPSEAEQKLLEARRERSNKISSLMGQYLLRGYKMLAITCPRCECILLEDKQKNKYCIACSEVDADSNKDNPAVCEQAARRTVEESMHRQLSAGEMLASVGPSQASANPSQTQSSTSNMSQHSPSGISPQEIRNEIILPDIVNPPQEAFGGTDLKDVVINASLALKLKLTWATNQLQSTNGVQDSLQLVNLISQTASALLAIKNLCRN